MKTLILFLIISSALSIFPKTAYSVGNEGGHGGDPYAYEFVSLGLEVYKEIVSSKNHHLTQKFKINTTTLLTKIKKSLVYSDEGKFVSINGQEVDAKNFYPLHDKIILNRTRWRIANLEQKLILILHEYLGLLGTELDIYHVSVNFKNLIQTVQRRLLRKNKTPIRYYGYEIASPPLYSDNETCDLNIPTIGKALERSKNNATSSCSAEQNRECEVIQTTMQSVHSATHIGYEYCEITSIAKAIN